MASAVPPVTVEVSVIGAPPKVRAGQRNAIVADLDLTIAGSAGKGMTLAIAVTLSGGLGSSGAPRLVDDAGGAKAVTARRVGASYVFERVPVASTTQAARRFRITNLRANASALPGGPLSGTSVLIAFVFASGPVPVRIPNQQLIVATVQRKGD
jgi:hypothetical protein